MAALLVTFTVISLPVAQGMTINMGGGGKVVEVKHTQKVSYLDSPLSTDTNPDRIKQLVRRAWFNKELRWSGEEQWQCFNNIIMHESSWNPWADNGAGWEETGGIPQAHPSSKMASAGDDYRENVWTQVQWGLDYIEKSYGSPCNAWDSWQQRAGNGSYGWY